MDDKIISVGIDIGTSTTQILFSELIIENLANDYTVPRFSIVDKKIIYESEIYFTPLLSKHEIDMEAVKQIVSEEYKKADITCQQVKTGAVIITGETARKENAALVLETLSGFAGDFVVATAGPDLESVLAGYGSGACMLSEQTCSCIVNIDIGGGTSNLAVFDHGQLEEAACLDVGGRLVKINSKSKEITYIYSKWKDYAEKHGISLEEGTQAEQKMLYELCSCMTDVLASALKLTGKNTDQGFYTNESQALSEKLKIDYITFSGGVADFVYGKKEEEQYKYDDIGVLLAEAVKSNQYLRRVPWLKAKETIRATVVGAGMYTTEISGSTICYEPKILPIKNVPVMRIGSKDMYQFGKMLKKQIPYYLNQTNLNMVAVAFDGADDTSFDGIQKRASEIFENIQGILANGLPIIIVVEADIAKALGFALKRLLPKEYPLICIDGIRTKNGDYIDIGCPIAGGQVLPVVIKTLVFNN